MEKTLFTAAIVLVGLGIICLIIAMITFVIKDTF